MRECVGPPFRPLKIVIIRATIKRSRFGGTSAGSLVSLSEYSEIFGRLLKGYPDILAQFY
jgi:hypothetical protein